MSVYLKAVQHLTSILEAAVHQAQDAFQQGNAVNSDTVWLQDGEQIPLVTLIHNGKPIGQLGFKYYEHPVRGESAMVYVFPQDEALTSLVTGRFASEAGRDIFGGLISAVAGDPRPHGSAADLQRAYYTPYPFQMTVGVILAGVGSFGDLSKADNRETAIYVGNYGPDLLSVRLIGYDRINIETLIRDLNDAVQLAESRLKQTLDAQKPTTPERLVIADIGNESGVPAPVQYLANEILHGIVQHAINEVEQNQQANIRFDFVEKGRAVRSDDINAIAAVITSLEGNLAPQQEIIK